MEALHPGIEIMQTSRVVARMLYPEYGHMIYSCSLIPEPECRTAAVDKYARIYFNPDFISKATVEEAAFVLIHEVYHVLLRHCARSKAIGADQTGYTARVANRVMDATIHENMQADGRLPFPREELIRLCTLQSEDLERNQPWEYHFEQVLKRHEQNAQAFQDLLDQLAGGAGDNGGFGDMPDDGSGASGRVAPWERGEPDEESGVSEPELEEIRQRVAEDIKQRRERGIGSMPDHMKRWADMTLKTVIDPTKTLRQMLTQAYNEVTSGNQMQSWQRSNRRQQQYDSSHVILPGSVGVVPRLELAIDTSGSMGELEITVAASVVKPVLKSFGGKLRVTSGDVGIQMSEVIRDVKQKMVLGGGGGTDMTLLLKQIQERPRRDRPDIVILVTDCQTEWPETPIREFKVLVLQVAPWEDVPSWMRKIDCTPIVKQAKEEIEADQKRRG